MKKIYLAVLLVLVVGLSSGEQLFTLDFYNFGSYNETIYNNTEIINPPGFSDDVIVYTLYNSSDQISAIYFQDMVLYSDDKNIVEKIKDLEAATKWG